MLAQWIYLLHCVRPHPNISVLMMRSNCSESHEWCTTHFILSHIVTRLAKLFQQSNPAPLCPSLNLSSQLHPPSFIPSAASSLHLLALILFYFNCTHYSMLPGYANYHYITMTPILSYSYLFCGRNWRSLPLPPHTHEQLCKLTPRLSYRPISVTQEMPEELTANTWM